MLIPLATVVLLGGAASAADLDYKVSWVGNSFSGADGKWVQNFFIHANARPDGSVITWSHWDEGGRRFRIYNNGDVIADRDEHANSLEAIDHQGRTWKIVVEYNDPKHNEFDFKPTGVTSPLRPLLFPMASALSSPD